ncbi:MAG: VanW family protein [Bacillota bacterium]
MKRVNEAPVFASQTVINGVDISGLSYRQGCDLALEQERGLLEKIVVGIQYNGSELSFDASRLGISTNTQELLDAAYKRNKTGALADDFDLSLTPVTQQCEIILDEEILAQNVGDFLHSRDIPANDATATFDPQARAFAYTIEKSGVAADVDKVLALVKEKIYQKDYSPIEVKGKLIHIVRPVVTAAMLRENTVSLGHSITIASNNEDRNVNIQLMCDAINGLVLMPGETLSLNGLVGKRTAEKGFRAAPSIIDGRLVDDLGGGICQLAGTLYNAALYAGMEIVERAHHSWPSEYLPIGLDATLNWDNKDLKIKNTTGYPLYFSAKLENFLVDVEIFGQKSPKGDEIDIETIILKEIKAPDPEILYTDELPSGVVRTVDRSRKGYEVEVYRHYLRGGEIVLSELISRDHFRPIRGTVLMGTNEVIK